MVDVFCPLELCRERNLARGDRYETQSEEQWNVWNKNVAYDMRVETHLHTPEECAEQILRKIKG
jgi:adenylylsulfate kinase/chloramphenicol 3-O phosphotransferase